MPENQRSERIVRISSRFLTLSSDGPLTPGPSPPKGGEGSFSQKFHPRFATNEPEERHRTRSFGFMHTRFDFGEYGARDRRDIEGMRLCECQPARREQLVGTCRVKLMRNGVGIRHEETRIETPRAIRRRDCAGDVVE